MQFSFVLDFLTQENSRILLYKSKYAKHSRPNLTNLQAKLTCGEFSERSRRKPKCSCVCVVKPVFLCCCSAINNHFFSMSRFQRKWIVKENWRGKYLIFVDAHQLDRGRKKKRCSFFCDFFFLSRNMWTGIRTRKKSLSILSPFCLPDFFLPRQKIINPWKVFFLQCFCWRCNLRRCLSRRRFSSKNSFNL